MKEDTIYTCRLCLIVQEFTNFYYLKDNYEKKYMLEIFLPELNLNLTELPIICEICVNSLEICYNFKNKCLETEERLHSLLITDENDGLVVFNLKTIMNCSSEQNLVETCRICLEIYNKQSASLANVETFCKNMIQICIPQIDLELSKNPVICGNCFRTLEIAYNFKTKCLNAEEILYSHCKNHFNLNSVISDEVKVKPVIKTEVVEIKTELEISEDNTTSVSSTIKLDDDDYEDKIKKAFKCNFCEYTTNIKRCLMRHEIIHKTFEDSELHKCTQCLFKTKRKDGLKRHQTTHEALDTLYKCSDCAYTTKHKGYLKVHELIHNNNNEQLTCTKCSFQAKIRSDLIQHDLAEHKGSNSKSVKLSKCPHCSYQAKFQCFLKRHMLVHSKPEKMFRCNLCKYESKRKDSLIKHGLVHRGEDAAIYKCTKCSYRGKTKNYLTRHMIIHETAMEMFKCMECAYETKRRHNLKEHMLVHEDNISV